MIIKLFRALILMLIDEEIEPYIGSSGQSRFYSGPTANSSRYNDLIKEYPYITHFIYLPDHKGSNSYSLTYDLLDQLKIQLGTDYEFDGGMIFFKTKNLRDDFNKIGYALTDDSRAAIAFDKIDKKQMGIISFTDENKFYITIRPKFNKEHELLKEVTMFYKSHEYQIHSEEFQNNFCQYKNFAIEFYVKDEAMAAELNFYVTSKELGTIL